jgi:hypothetical protein
VKIAAIATVLLLNTTAFAAADDAKKITVGEVIALSQALRNLDGHLIVIKRNGQDETVMVPWEFGSGSLRMKIAGDIAIADRIVNAAEQSRVGMMKEAMHKAGVAELKPGAPETDAFLKQYQETMEQPAAGAKDLQRIKASELKLDKNEIAVTVLAALKPILDADEK